MNIKCKEGNSKLTREENKVLSIGNREIMLAEMTILGYFKHLINMKWNVVTTSYSLFRFTDITSSVGVHTVIRGRCPGHENDFL